MARYSFQVGTPTGSIQTLEVAGDTPDAARRSLEDKGYFVFDRQEQARTLPRIGRPAFLAPRVTPRALLVFNQELLALVRAGLPILSALDLLRERGQQPRLRSLLEVVRDEVKGGAALSAAMARHTQVFGPLYTASLRAGEQSGNFVDALTRYVEYQKRILTLRQRLRAALTYPAILITASLAVIVFLLTFVVPTFSTIYGDMDSELPVATRILVGITGQLKRLLPLAALAVTAFGLALWRWRLTPEGRRLTDRWILALPWVGTLVSGYLFSRFARTLAMMQAGGIPMIPSLETTLATVGNAYLDGKLRTAIPRVAAGNTLADALDRSGVSPPLLVELVSVGESSGSLGEMLGHVADLYDAEMDTRLTALAAAIEPVIMIGMGLVVAAIVVIMYLPIFHLSTVIR
ncbi:MAG: type II secretion system F family protein [candidate division NC10 bacterium]|nr:type II secretion system F family protein [candidate division NC10 bacterium]